MEDQDDKDIEGRGPVWGVGCGQGLQYALVFLG
jgi:hypothetical protein